MTDKVKARYVRFTTLDLVTSKYVPFNEEKPPSIINRLCIGGISSLGQGDLDLNAKIGVRRYFLKDVKVRAGKSGAYMFYAYEEVK